MQLRENTMKPKEHKPATTMHNNSHSIPKFKPKVRIVHIFAPVIIKTDVENFRELVQRLTGKPAKRIGGEKKRRAAMGGGEVVQRCNHIEGSVKSKLEEGEGLFLGGLGDIDGLFQGLGDLPLLPLSNLNTWM